MSREVVMVVKEYLTEEQCDYFEVGVKSYMGVVEKIVYHEPDSVDKTHYCDVYFDNQSVMRILSPDNVQLKAKEEKVITCEELDNNKDMFADLVANFCFTPKNNVSKDEKQAIVHFLEQTVLPKDTSAYSKEELKRELLKIIKTL